MCKGKARRRDACNSEACSYETRIRETSHHKVQSREAHKTYEVHRFVAKLS